MTESSLRSLVEGFACKLKILGHSNRVAVPPSDENKKALPRLLAAEGHLRMSDTGYSGLFPGLAGATVGATTSAGFTALRTYVNLLSQFLHFRRGRNSQCLGLA